MKSGGALSALKGWDYYSADACSASAVDGLESGVAVGHSVIFDEQVSVGEVMRVLSGPATK